MKARNQIIFDFYNTIYNPKTGKLFWGMLTLLKKLQTKYRLILVSSYSSQRVCEIYSLNISKYFDKIFLPSQKSLPIFKTIGRSAYDNIIIGDRNNEEISIGKKLEYKTIKVNPLQENPSITIKILIKKGKI